MEIKKSPEADLEKGKGLSLLLGLVVALSLTFVSLEWRSSVAQAGNLDGAGHKTEMEEALLVKEEQPEISLKSLSHRSSPSRPRSSYLRNSRS